MQLTKKIIEKKYNCQLDRDFGFDDHHLFWRAHENESDDKDLTFEYAEGWTLQELVDDIESRLA